MNNFYLTTELVNQHIQELTDQATRYRNSPRRHTTSRWLRRRRRSQDDGVVHRGASLTPAVFPTP